MKTKRCNNLRTLAIFLLCVVGMGGACIGQMPYFNEWYRPQQSYVKIRLAADGLYRVTMADLEAAGIPNLSSLNAASMQLFFRGVEVPMYAQDSLNGRLDFFDFIGKRNDGLVDSLLYRDSYDDFGHRPELQPNRFTSIFTDTTAYFLTWDHGNVEHLTGISPTNFGAYTPMPYFKHRSKAEYMDDAFFGGGGEDDIWNILNPDYVTGEGFLSISATPANGPGDRQRILATPGFANSGNATHITARVVGTNAAPNHVFTLDIDQVARYRDTTAFINIGTYAFDYALPLNQSTFFDFRVYGVNTAIVDFQAISWVTMAYDRKFDLSGDNQAIFRDWNQSDSTYIRIYNAPFTSTAWIIDEVRKERIAATVVGDTLKFLVPGHVGTRELHFYTDHAILKPIDYATPALHNLSDVDGGAEFVIITHRKFAASAAAYADYRSQSTVNPLTSKVVYIDEIWDEFGYGSFTPWAIKNFCRYALEAWTVKPKHFLLWGKGRNCPRCDNSDNYVPVYGTPANDWEYVSNMRYDSVDVVPLAGIGRVSIYNDQHGFAYLEKVQDYEEQPYSAQYKSGLFMGGGRSGGEQASILNANVEKMMPFLTDPPMAGNGFFHQKYGNGDSTNTPLLSEQLINNGLGILEFFGHSAVNIFELDILEPNRYTNYHKYPFMIAFGCSGGNFNEAIQSYGERAILEPQRGAIAYLGNTTRGFLLSLPYYGKSLFQSMLRDKYGASLGEVFQAAIDDFTREHNDAFGLNHAKQLDLQGDPSIHLKFPMKPDLRVGLTDLYFPDGDPKALNSTFALNIIVHNDGLSFQDSFAVTVQQLLPSGLTYVHDTIQYRPFANLDTLKLVLQNPNGLLSAGTNEFTVKVDSRNRLDEIYENNNRATVSQVFLGNLATPLQPAEFAIVGEPTVFLQASMFLMNLASPVRYSFEIDTVSTFDSPFKKASPAVAGTAALGEWPIGFNMTPGQVYYWRTRLSDFYPEQWIGSSYKYIPGKTGWSQSQTSQMTKDQLLGLELDPLNRTFAFMPTPVTLHALVQLSGKAVYFMGSFASQGEAQNGVLCTAIDAHTLVPLVRATPNGDWRFIAAPVPGDDGSLRTLEQMVANMADGDYFLLASSSNPRMPNWSDGAIRSLELLGANFAELRAMEDGERILMLGRKGAPAGSAIVVIHPNLTVPGQGASHDLLRVLAADGTEGAIRSTVIGPTKHWEACRNSFTQMDAFNGDSAWLSIYGIRADGSEDLLLANATQPRQSLSGIGAEAYARLRLQARVKDAQHYSAAQLRDWEVYHDAAPDLAIDASLGMAIPDSINEGERLHLRAFVRNLTSVPTDSVWVRYALQAGDRQLFELGRRQYGSFAAKEIKQIELDANTAALGLPPGDMTLIMEVNPDNAMVEQYHFNNLYYHPIKVRTDLLGPLVDVTVDGKHLMGFDIVSPNPEIVILANDDNRYLPVTVSDSTFRIWFGTSRTYTENAMLTIDNNDSIEKSPVRMPENKTRLTYRPGRLSDGEYTLAVQGYDLKGNAAGTRPYVIQMKVVNEKSISQVLPYPNPFSTACHFAYTLTGDEKPSRFDVEIYTITGRLVKVVDLLALGDVHFGHNITAYAWDGRDEYGDLLANGVYIYRVNTRFSEPGEVKIIDEETAQFFQNGFGKMYLMR